MERLLPTHITDAFKKDVGFDFGAHSFLVCRGGSATHGTKLSTSDDDFFGVIVPPVEFVMGLRSFDHWEPKALGVDVKVYSLRKYITLLLKNNPNVLETLWLRDVDYCRVHTANDFWLLRAMRDIFSSLRAYHSFTGYAYDQLIRLETSRYSREMGEKRKKLVDQFGYDPKNASHLIRLFRSGVEFVRTGQLTVYRPDAEELKAIKRGEWSLSQVKAEGERLAGEMKAVKEVSPLPKEPNEAKAEGFLVNTMIREMEAYVAARVLSI